MADFDSPGVPPGPHRDQRRLPPRPAPEPRDGAGLGGPALFPDLPATIWTTDDQLRVTFIEGQLLRRLRLTADRLVGRTLPELLLDGREDHPLIQGHFTALSGHETTVRIEWGGDIYSARLAPRRAPDGRIIGCIGVQQQIGWHPEDDLTVREGEIRLQRVVDWNVAGIAFGDEQGRITDANDAFLTLTGYAREDLIPDGLSWPSLTAVEFHHRQIEAVEEILASGRCRPFETELIRRDGRRISVLVSAARLSARRREGVAFVLDISRYKAAERFLKAELAAADLLLQAPDRAAAFPALADLIAEHAHWPAVGIWMASPEGPVRRAQHGESHLPETVATELIAHALESGQVAWQGVAGFGVWPMGTIGAILAEDWPTYGALAETDLDPDRLPLTGTLASRLRRWLDDKK